jgi:small subunit ribosomal protein S13e
VLDGQQGSDFPDTWRAEVGEVLTRGRQAVSVRKHLERNRKDKDSKFRLILIESRIHRLARYYRTVGVLPPNWKYESATASTMVA